MMPQPWSGNSPGGAHRDSQWREVSESDLVPGPLTLTGDLFLVMLNDATGKLRARGRIAGYALAGALLVELSCVGRLAFDPERIWVLDRRPLEDPVLDRLLGQVLGEPERTGVTYWVECLATTAVDVVVERLVQARWIRCERRLGLSGRHVVFVPLSRNAVFWRAGRLTSALERGPIWSDLTLAALLDAVGVADQTTGCLRGPAADHLIRSIAERLSCEYPQVAVICGHVQALAARAAISLR